MNKMIRLKREVEVELHRLDFHPFEAVQRLDVAAYDRVSHARIELGYFESDCCRRLVSAVIKKGTVMSLELEPCKKGGVPQKQLTKFMTSLPLKRVRPGKRSRSFRMSLGGLLGNVGGIIVETWTCYRVCILGYCFVCCEEDGKWYCE